MATLKKTVLTISAPSEASAADAADGAGHVDFNTEDLVGCQISAPIFDKSGLLLLAKGALVTSRFKELLVTRSIRSIKLSQADALTMRAKKSAPPAPVAVEVDSDVIKKIDDMVDSGQMFIEDASPKFQDRMVRHGNRGYDRALREQLIAKHAETCSLLDEMIKAAAHSETMNGGDVSTVVADYLSHLTLDEDLVHDVMSRATRFAGFAQDSLHAALLAMSLAIELKMGEDSVRVIGLCGLLNNWGMTFVPPEITDAKRVLGRIEYLEITKHVMHTVNVLERVTGLPPLISLICYQVHERPDGSGYPRGRQGNSIHPYARILNVADAYVALTSPRPFRPPVEPHAAIECLIRQVSDNRVDRAAVAALLRILTQFGIGRQVQLSDGSTAIVRRRNGDNYNAPFVQILVRPDGTRLDPRDDSNLVDLAEAKLTVLRVLPVTGRTELEFSPELLNQVRT